MPKKITLLILGLMYTGITFAQESVQQLTVHKALEYANSHNTSLNLMRERYNAKKAEQRIIYGINSPTVSYAKEGMNGNGFLEQRWTVSQSLDFPTAIIHRNSMVNKELSAIEAEMRSAELDLKADVKTAYSKLAYAYEILQLRNEQVQLAGEIKDISIKRHQVGEASRIDILQSSLRLTEAQNNYNDARNQFHNARYSLFNLIGLDVEDQNYSIQFPDSMAYFLVDLQQSDVLNALPNHPLITKDKFLIDAAESNVKAQRSQLLPSLTGSYFRQDFGNGYDFNAFEIGVSVPLWFAVNQAPKINMAKANFRAGELQKNQDLLWLKMNAEQTWHSFENAESQIKAFQETVQSESTQLLDLTREAYRVGEIPLLNLLEAQRTYLSSQERYFSALLDYYTYLIQLEKYLQTDLIYAKS